MSIAEAASAARESIGRYFNLVSLLPTVLLVTYSYLLISSGAWVGPPELSTVVRSVSTVGLGEVALLVLISVALAAVLHPLQFSFVQFLEGYWGHGPLAARLRAWRMSSNWRWKQRAHELSNEATAILAELDLNENPTRTNLLLVARRDEANRILANFPEHAAQVMPTRLGNVLRFYEYSSGLPYGLDAIQVMPFLSRVAPPEHMRYVNDQRSLLDLSARMTVTGLIASGLTFLFLWDQGLWLLVALVPYAVAYLSYRGAIVAAGSYGRAIGVVVALNRFALYERLHLELPTDTRSERVRNGVLGHMLAYSPSASLPYRHPNPDSRSSASEDERT